MLKDLHIEKFGHFQDYSVELSPGFVVFYGANEAGKSTLTAFIESLLFGFRNKNQKKMAHYQNGQALISGTLTLKTEKFGELKIKRSKDKTASLSIRNEWGEEVDPEVLDRYLKGMTREHFLELQEFNQEQLHELTATTKEEWQQLFYTLSGSGSLTLYRISKSFEKRAEEIYTPQSKKREMDQLVQDYRALADKKKVLKEQEVDYLNILKQKDTLGEKLEKLEGTYQKALEDYHHKEQLMSLEGTYQRYKALEELAQEEETPLTKEDRLFVSQAPDRLANLREEETLYQERLKEAEEEGQINQERYKVLQAFEENLLEGQEELEAIQQEESYFNHLKESNGQLLGRLLLYKEEHHLPEDWQGELALEEENFDQVIALKEEREHLAYQEKEAKEALEKAKVDLGKDSQDKKKKKLMDYVSTLSGIGLAGIAFCMTSLGVFRFVLAVIFFCLFLSRVYLTVKVDKMKAELSESMGAKESLAQERLQSIQRKKECVEEDLERILANATFPISDRDDLIDSKQFESGRDLLDQVRKGQIEVQQLAEEKKQVVNRVRKSLSPLFEQIPVKNAENSLESLLKDVRAYRQEGQSLGQQLAEKEKTLSLYRQQLARLSDEMTRIQERLIKLEDLVQVDDVKSLLEQVERDSKRQEAKASRLHFKEIMGDYLKSLEEMDQPIEASDLIQQKEYLKNLFATKQECQKEWMEVSSRLKQMEEDGRYEEVLSESEEVRQEIREKMKEWASNQLALSWVQTALDLRLGQSIQTVFKRAEGYLVRLTEGRYVRLVSKGKQLDVLSKDGDRYALKDLSVGTVEQLYTALRLAMAHGEELPLLIDDAFVNFDPVRRREAYELLKELGQKQQILLMTFDHLACQYADQVVELGS